MPTLRMKELPGVCRAEIHPCDSELDDLNYTEPEVRVICLHPHYRFTPHDFPSRTELDAQLAANPPQFWGNLLMVPPEQYDYVISLRVVPSGEPYQLGDREQNVGLAMIPGGPGGEEPVNEEAAWAIIQQSVRHWEAYCNGKVYWMLVIALEPMTNQDLFDDGWYYESRDLYEPDDADLDNVLSEALPSWLDVDVEQAPWLRCRATLQGGYTVVRD